MMYQYLLSAGAVLLNAFAAADTFAADCQNLGSSLQLPNATIWFSEFVAAGTNLTFPDNNATCGRASQVVSSDICRIALYASTSERSGISMEAWLPRNWTGRFLSTGNGGLSGCIYYEDLAYTSALGFASVGANNGHNGTSGNAFYNNPEIVTDFAYRSVHTNVVLGKEISQQFYNQPHTKSYYLGCSTGGRQGLKSAQAFPEDFDGIAAGAPAIAFNNLSSWSGHFLKITGPPTAPTFIPQPLWVTIHQDILSQCDELDGYKDGIIEDPLLCHYKPSSLSCSKYGANSSACLTDPQISTVRKIFSPLYGKHHALVYPRMQPGSEVQAANIYYNGQPFPYTSDWFRYAIYNDPSWDPYTINAADYAYSAAKNPSNIETWDLLEGFKAMGGKLLMYHGQMDAVISSDNSPRYYEHVSKGMNLSPTELDDFFRFFRIGGMGHCSGGDGAWAIGQTNNGNAGLEPGKNVLMAVVKWVEDGTAPEGVLGTKWVGDKKGNAVQFERVHCKYPLRNHYKGGDATKKESWECIV